MAQVFKLKQKESKEINLEIDLDTKVININFNIEIDKKFLEKEITEEFKDTLKSSIINDFINELKKFDVGDFLILKKLKDNLYLIIKLSENIKITEKGLKINFLEYKSGNYLDVPIALRMDGRTTSINPKKYETKELRKIVQILERVIMDDKNIYSDEISFFLDKNRQATASGKGYIKQAQMGLFLVFYDDNYKKLKTIKIEGSQEDIHLELRDGVFNYIQVKIAENPNDETKFEKNRFKEAISGLNETSNKIEKYNIKNTSLIYASNSYYQPLKEENERIKLGQLPYFIKKLSDVHIEERKELIEEYNLSKKLSEKFSIVRVTDDYLNFKEGYYSDSFRNLTDELEIKNITNNIYNPLFRKFIANSEERETSISIFEIANTFTNTNSKKQDTFNKKFEEELEEIEEEDISDILKEENIEDSFDEILKEQFVIEKFYELKKTYENSNGKIVTKKINEFILNSCDEFINLKLFSKKLKNEKIIYMYLLYRIYFNKKSIEKIKEVFCLEGLWK
ncbi:MAG: hypothetical protein ACRC6E_08495 [Fusobacteriaceae bacterium]